MVEAWIDRVLVAMASGIGALCAASDSAVLQRVERDGERDQHPTVNTLHAGADLEHVAVAQLAEHAPVSTSVPAFLRSA